MITYIAAFIFYTLAMIGVLIGGFVIYKKMIAPIKNDSKGMIQIVDSCAVAPKKNLMIVKVNDEKFLIALDSERTTFLTKLETKNENFRKALEQKLTEGGYNLDSEIAKEIQDTVAGAQNRFDDTSKTRNDDIQRQFMELYNKDELEVHNMQSDEI